MSFKIIGIRALKGCSDDILKKILPELFYPFDSNYSFDYKTKKISRRGKKQIPEDFFFSKNKFSTLENINVQAIVGKNGKGKSSIVELLIRILNNFYKQYKIGSVTEKLMFVENLYADLFFEVNGKTCIIHVDSRKIKEKGNYYSITAKFFEEENLIYDSTKEQKSNSYREEIIKLEDLFFSMYVNYSLYGLDDGDYIEESAFTKDQNFKNENYDKESWLTQIFHKNDGYQTPIVLHPFREGGQVNIRNEKYLISQRLLSLILDEANNEFHLTEDLVADKIKLTFNEKDTLEVYIDKIITSRNLERNQYKEVESLLASDLSKVSKSKMIQLIDDYYNFLQQNQLLFLKFKKNVQKKKARPFLVKDTGTFTDLTLVNLANFSRLLTEDSTSIPNLDFVLVYDSLMKIKDDKLKNKIKFIIEETGNFNFFTYNLFQILTIYFNFWKSHFKLVNDNIFKYKKYQLEQSLFYYCLVKSYKSINYPKYVVYNRGDTIVGFASKLSLSKQNTINPHTEFLTKVVDEDNSHISLKLRQSKKILELCFSASYSKLIKLYKKYVEKTDFVNIEELNEAINEVTKSESKVDRLDYLPPRIFQTDIFLRSVYSGSADINISKLSSGEYQKNSIISSIVYHLKNIDSVQPEAKSKMKALSGINITPTYNYKNINVFLDEIELYFHPEYQRLFLNDLLTLLGSIKFKSIRNINFLFITHSPFILSDIPQQNILFLNDNAKPENLEKSYNTFGANIHDLLAHNFFLKDGVVGEFALQKINKIIEQLNQENLKDSSENEKNELLKNINLVGEIFLKNKLLDMYYLAFDRQKRIEELEAELLKLKQDDRP